MVVSNGYVHTYVHVLNTIAYTQQETAVQLLKTGIALLASNVYQVRIYSNKFTCTEWSMIDLYRLSQFTPIVISKNPLKKQEHSKLKFPGDYNSLY